MEYLQKLKKNINENISIILKFSFIIITLAFAIPSIIYYINNGTILNFNKYFCFLLTNNSNREYQTIIYLAILGIMTLIYFLILKNHKAIFKNIKELVKYIAIVSVIYIAIIPFTCSDVFYYLGTGRIESKYNQNPYYTTIEETIESQKIDLEKDTVMKQASNNDWANTTVVYGPIWSLVSRIVGALSCGNIDIGLLIFKILNIILHLLNCYLIYKISHKKLFVLLYGLNPFILIEGLMSVHNDMFVVFFILLALYFLIKKKNLALSVISLALASGIKYFAILLLPFFIIYFFRKEKVSKRFIECIKYGLLFFAILGLPYLIYIQDINVFAGIFTQQGKLAKNFYIILKEYFSNNVNMVTTVNKILMLVFVLMYTIKCISLLTQKNIILRKEFKSLELILAIFIFLLITNFQPWYIMWLYPLIIWQSSNNIKLLVQVSILTQFANSIFLAYTESWKNGTPFTFIMVTGTLLLIIFNDKRRKGIN